MSIETIVYTLPACWASALINDDQTGLNADEIVRLPGLYLPHDLT